MKIYNFINIINYQNIKENFNKLPQYICIMKEKKYKNK